LLGNIIRERWGALLLTLRPPYQWPLPATSRRIQRYGRLPSCNTSVLAGFHATEHSQVAILRSNSDYQVKAAPRVWQSDAELL